MKKVDIPSIELPVERICRMTLNLAERGLIGQFTSLWNSPKAINGWLQRNWRPLVTEGIQNHFVGRGYYVFVFYSVEDRDLYINKWTLDFDPTQDVMFAVLV